MAVWLNRKNAAELIRESVHVLDRVWRPKLPPGCEKGNRSSLLIDGAKLCEVYFGEKQEKAIQDAIDRGASTPEDALMSGPSSPSLERFRAARAEMAEIELSEKKKAVIPLEDASAAVRIILRSVGKAAEVLQRRFGPEAITILEQAAEQSEKLLDEHFGSDDGGSGDNCPGEPAKDQGVGEGVAASETPHNAAVRRADDHHS